jgi:hypothetical protein
MAVALITDFEIFTPKTPANTVQVSGYVLAVPSETTNITPTGVVGGNTSESTISFTAIDENMTLASSNRAELIDNVLPLSLETTNLTATGVLGVNISKSVLIVDSEVFPPTTPVGVIFVVSDGTANT